MAISEPPAREMQFVGWGGARKGGGSGHPPSLNALVAEAAIEQTVDGLQPVVFEATGPASGDGDVMNNRVVFRVP